MTRKSTPKYEVVYSAAGSSVVVITGVSRTDAEAYAKSFGTKATVRPVKK